MSQFLNSGGCLCGGVRFNTTAATAELGLCHCKMCRRWCGGLPLAVIHAKVALVKDETLVWWQSSDWGARGFCGRCGCSLFWRTLGDNQEEWTVSAGALDNEDGLVIDHHIFYDDKPVFYETADKAERQGGAYQATKES